MWGMTRAPLALFALLWACAGSQPSVVADRSSPEPALGEDVPEAASDGDRGAEGEVAAAIGEDLAEPTGEASASGDGSAPVETPTEIRELGPSVEDGEAVGAWIAERVARARAGTREFVRLPLAEQSTGWGCVCPEHYVGGSPDQHDGGATWLRVLNDSGTPLPAAPSETVREGDGESWERSFGQVVRVDGYFDGEVVREDLREGPDGPSDWIYDLSVFHVTRVHRRMDPERAIDARVALLGDPVDVGVCARVVRDDDPPLNVRARPSARARVVGGLDDGARITPLEWRGDRWIRIDSPVAGWIWVDHTARACD